MINEISVASAIANANKARSITLEKTEYYGRHGTKINDSIWDMITSLDQIINHLEKIPPQLFLTRAMVDNLVKLYCKGEWYENKIYGMIWRII